jgi:copper chaperone CopZ
MIPGATASHDPTLGPLPLSPGPPSMRTTLRLRLPSIHAVRAIYTALQGVEGVVHADVSRHGATIEHDGRATAERLREAVESAGFEVMELVEERRRLTVRKEE